MLFRSEKTVLWRGEELGRKSSLVLNNSCEYSKPLLAGDNVHRYEPVNISRYIDVNKVEKRYYEKPKILIRQLGTCINATLDTEGCITMQSIYNLAIPDDEIIMLKFVLGLLNSSLYGFIYCKVSGDKQIFQRIILENIKQLPIPAATHEQMRAIASLADAILSNKNQDPQADTSAEEREIDRLVYALYDLTKEEIEIVEGEKV